MKLKTFGCPIKKTTGLALSTINIHNLFWSLMIFGLSFFLNSCWGDGDARVVDFASANPTVNPVSPAADSSSHDNSILAVARNLVDAAAVDSSIWEYYNHKNPVLTSATRIIKKSEPYGIPPLVTSGDLAAELKARIRRLLFSMHLDVEGQKILQELMIDRFIAPREEWYEPIRQMKAEISLLEENPHASKKP